MHSISTDIRDLIVLLKKHRVRFAICGGHAVAFHGYVRMTMDVDIVVLPDAQNASRLLAALDAFGFGDAGIPRHALLKEGTAVSLGVQPNQVDLLTSISSQPTQEVIRNAVRGRMWGLAVRIVAYDDLIRAKREAARPKDRLDVEELQKTAATRAARHRRSRR